jgi:hypothetical protein
VKPEDMWEEVTMVLDLSTPDGLRTASVRVEASKALLDQLRDGLPGDVRVTNVRFIQ